MQKKWNGLIDIELLTNKIVEYFVKKDFEINKIKMPDGYQIIASGSQYLNIEGYVVVCVKEADRGFSVNVEHSGDVGGIGEISRSLILTTLFGGGYFLLRKLKSREAWLTFNKKLWEYINKTVQELIVSY
jgi:hypothetical protein